MGESTGHRWIPKQKASYAENVIILLKIRHLLAYTYIFVVEFGQSLIKLDYSISNEPADDNTSTADATLNDTDNCVIESSGSQFYKHNKSEHNQVVMVSSNGSIFGVTGPYEPIPITKTSDVEIWCLFDLHLTNRLSIETPVISDAIHYNDVMMGAMASQITSLTTVYSTVYSGADQRKHQSPRHRPLYGEFTDEQWIPRTKDM